MRLKNKILIEGDTLRIFETVDNYHGLKVGDKVKFKDISDGVEYDSIASNKYFVNPDTIYTIIALHPGHPEVPNPNTFATLKALNDPNVKEIKKVYTGYLKKEGITKGDTLRIFETVSPERKRELEDIAREIYNNSGNSDANERDEMMKEMGIMDDEERNEVAVMINALADLEMNEGSFNPMKGKKMYYHVLEDGGYGNIGHQGYYNTPEEAQKRADELADMFPRSEFYIEAYPSTKEPVTVTMESNTVNEAKEKKDPAEKKKAEKTNYGHKDMSDVDMVNPYELRKGIRIEMVDTDDYEKAMDKAVKKLKKDPIYYSNLIANAKETKGKRADVPTEIKDKKLNKVSDKLKDKANEMSVSKKDATKKNANDSLNKKEKASGKPKGVKEMTMKSKSSKGMKSMTVPGKEKKVSLKENINLWEAFKKNILR